jgi:hypothetical protein
VEGKQIELYWRLLQNMIYVSHCDKNKISPKNFSVDSSWKSLRNYIF